LKRYVEVAADRHQFTRHRVEQLAEVVAEREIATANDTEAYQRILALTPCASSLHSPLLRQSLRHGDTAAAASMTLIDADLMEPSQRLRTHASDADGAWRAVGVRASQRPGDRAIVYRALTDPVREAAVATIRNGPLAADAGPVLDVVRHDPQSAVRVSAMAALAETGDLQAILLARDLWDGMPEALRVAFLQALDSIPLRRTAGVELLSRIAQADDSMMGEIAASLLYKSGVHHSALAVGRLVRALHSGTSSEQLLALATLGLREAEVLPGGARSAAYGGSRCGRLSQTSFCNCHIA
jgi:hypothetical protein